MMRRTWYNSTTHNEDGTLTDIGKRKLAEKKLKLINEMTEDLARTPSEYEELVSEFYTELIAKHNIG